MPQILGPLLESKENSSEGGSKNELNSVSDNPVTPVGETPTSGGNFYGGDITTALDELQIGPAKLAELLERQSSSCW